MMINGTDDPQFPWEGTDVPAPLAGGATQVPILDHVGVWGELNGCSAQPNVVEIEDQYDDGTTLERWSYTRCSAETLFYKATDSLIATVAVLFPEVSERELSTLRKFASQAAVDQFVFRQAEYGGLLPFENGGPGLTNGVASLRFTTGQLHGDSRAQQVAWTSPPDLAGPRCGGRCRSTGFTRLRRRSAMAPCGSPTWTGSISMASPGSLHSSLRRLRAFLPRRR
jgi:hypothetical protein